MRLGGHFRLLLTNLYFTLSRFFRFIFVFPLRIFVYDNVSWQVRWHYLSFDLANCMLRLSFFSSFAFFFLYQVKDSKEQVCTMFAFHCCYFRCKHCHASHIYLRISGQKWIITGGPQSFGQKYGHDTYIVGSSVCSEMMMVMFQLCYHCRGR